MFVQLLVLMLVVGGAEGSVSCGGHREKTCADCPGLQGAKWCNADCSWCHETSKCYLAGTDCAAQSVATAKQYWNQNYDINVDLRCVKEELEQQGFSWVNGHRFRRWLLRLGAAEDDLSKLESGKVHAQVKRDNDPKSHFRQIAFTKFVLDDTKSFEDEPFIKINISAITKVHSNETDLKISEEPNESANKKYRVREWNFPPEEYASSSVSTTIARLNKLLNPNVHHYQSHVNQFSTLTIHEQSTIRVNKHESLLAEPTPEGVHQDGYETAMITLVGRYNIAKIGETRLWNLKQPKGNYDSDEFGKINDNNGTPTPIGFDWDNCLFNKALESPWDTIIMNDRMVKHETRKFVMDDKAVPSYRDVIISLLRKPYIDGSDKTTTANTMF